LGINVLSCFDGISAGQLALQKSNIKVDNYFSSEIDKYAIKITQKNFPNTIQLGDINNWREWNLPKIDLLIGGSPCQGFSVSGYGLNFDDPRSKLFFVFNDIVKYYNPEYFLLENVKMKQEWQDIISEKIGVKPIVINSALLSAQSRKRLYWTNIKNIEQPEDKCILLKNIIETGEVDRDKSYCIDANYYKGGNLKSYFDDSRRQMVFEKPYQSSKRLMVKDCIQTWRKLTPKECERLQTFPDNYTEGISNTQRYKSLGNSFTVSVISHIFSFLPKEYKV
jgi:DNA-cytosine methyltransferase